MNILKKHLKQKKKKKLLKNELKNLIKKEKEEGEKKKWSFGTKALVSLIGIPLGLLIGTGVGNILIFVGWFMAIIFGLRGMRKDENKFPAIIALAIAVGLLISTFTFLEGGVF